DIASAAAQDVGGFAHQTVALVGGDLAPRLKALLGGREGKIEVGLFGMRHGADLLAGRRIEDRQCLAADSRPPRALAEQVDVGVHGALAALPARPAQCPPPRHTARTPSSRVSTSCLSLPSPASAEEERATQGVEWLPDQVRWRRSRP